MNLPSPEGSVALRVTLALIDDMERIGGSLCRLADRLAQGDVTFAESLKILSVVYAHAGKSMCAPEIGAHLLVTGPAPPLLLAEIVLSILRPLEEMGVIREDVSSGKPQPASSV